MAGPGKCFLVTGPPGVGKTTLIMRVFETLKTSNPNLKVQGFYTREIRQESERVGFEVVTLDGRRGPLASTTISRAGSEDHYSNLGSLVLSFCILPISVHIPVQLQFESPESLRWPNVGKYRVDIASFESLALPELQVREDTDLFIIDEVGKMEMYSSSFFPAVLKVLESNIPVLASVPIPKFGRDVPGVARLKNHPGSTMFTLSTSNRDAVKDQIYSILVDSLSKQ